MNFKQFFEARLPFRKLILSGEYKSLLDKQKEAEKDKSLPQIKLDQYVTDIDINNILDILLDKLSEEDMILPVQLNNAVFLKKI